MRVTEGMINERFLYTNSKLTEKKLKTQTQLASNSKFETISDDVAGSLKAIRLDTQIKRTDTFTKNAESGQEFLNASLSSLDQTTSELQNIIKLATDAGNYLNKDNYSTYATSIKNSLGSIVQLMNDKHNDMYLFGGTNYTEDVVTLDSNGLAVKSTADRSGEVKVRISNSATESINISGDKILNSGIFESINSIISSLSSGATITKDQIDQLNVGYNNILNVQSLAGEKVSKFNNVQNLLSNYKTSYEELLSNVQEVDAAKLMVDLQQQDYLLQVSYKLLASNNTTSVLDYL